MSGSMPIEEVKKHVRVYLGVFVALLILTGVTVWVSYFHLPIGYAVLVALAVASLKGAMVALFFMHLSHEKKIIYSSLLLTLVFFVVLMSIGFYFT